MTLADEIERLANDFHETYERLAPSFGYETRPDTKVFDPACPNGRLMIAVCGEVMSRFAEQVREKAANRTVIQRVGRAIEAEWRESRDLPCIDFTEDELDALASAASRAMKD